MRVVSKCIILHYMKRELELYIHIPFCARKCGYCDFLSAPAEKSVQAAYVQRLCREIEEASGLAQVYEVSTVFFGGGTPSLLDAGHIRRIMGTIKDYYPVRADAEITLEANPGTIDQEKLEIWREARINRLSMGLQSADNRELKLLGRIHTWEEFLDNYRLARAAGFRNINVDLMSALPGQTCGGWKDTLLKVADLGPEHVSAYSLIVEEGTPFYVRYGEHPELLPTEEEDRQMYEDTRAILGRYGYERYEISNYARPGYACRHNLGYWNRTEYKGFGLGAASLLENARTTNQSDLNKYLDGQYEGSREELSEQAVREEYFFLGLRKMEGVDPGPYRGYYEKLLEKLTRQGLIVERNGRICLTDRGIDVSNYVLAQFLDD